MKNVLEYLEATAGRLPDKMAVTDGEESVTFAELKSVSSRIGRVLSDYISPSQPVAVMMKKSTKTLQIFMGIVYAGGFYCLLDPDFPDERHRSQLSTLQTGLMITEPDSLDKIERLQFSGNVITTEELFKKIESADSLPVKKDIAEGTPLYCNFTSGSTGVPKGVLVGHSSVISFIDSFTSLFNITEEDVIGNQAPFDFDVSVKDIYSSLKTGATLVIIPTAFFRFPNNVMDMLEKYEVTTLTWAVSALVLLNRLHEFMYKVPPKIDKILFSGEEMPSKHLKDWMNEYPDAEFVNLYGPTEITCNCTYYVVDREFGKHEVIPMGKAFPNERVFLLDENNQEVTAPGVEGEVCVSGTALGLGYLGDPERTAAAFTQNPLNGRWLEPIYRTGDLATYDQDGNLVYSSRKDFQIKHMGQRIELGDIEAAAQATDGVERACCTYDQRRKRIRLYYVGTIDEKGLADALAATLPPYMEPNHVRRVDQMPLTKNGKIDRKALDEMGR